MEAKQSHVAILPASGMGHLIPLAELAKRLSLHHNFLVTLIIITDGSPMIAQRAILESLPKTINLIFLPTVSLSDLPENAAIELRIAHAIAKSRPALHNTLKLLCESNPISALVIDLFGFPAIDVAKELRISPFLFFTTTAMFLSFILHMPKLDKTFQCDYMKDLPEPICLPGCVPLHGKDFTDSTRDRKSEAYKRFLERSVKYNSVDGIMVNSFMELEQGTFEAFKQIRWITMPIHPIGPLIQTSSSNGTESNSSNCLKWLDKQPLRSVLFVSFGSGGTLSQQQLYELAIGLEMSEQKFLWVIRSPSEKTANEAYFTVQSKNNPFDFLPKGFLERTKDKGLVVLAWAPQIQVLSHSSTGGFLTHCGWNSTLESMVNGVPLIAWPLYAEQRMNALLLTEDLKVAMRVNVDENGIVDREQIAKYAKYLIEGEEGKQLRGRMKYFNDAAAKALAKDGSSSKSLFEVTRKWIVVQQN